VPAAPESVPVCVNYEALWQSALSASHESRPLAVDMVNTSSFLETKASLSQSKFRADEKIELSVWVR
jgi:hypothetical protein